MRAKVTVTGGSEFQRPLWRNPMRKPLALLLSSALLGTGIALSSPATAQAKTRFVDGIGLITGYYHPGPVDYTGLKQPSHNGFCVQVERMAAGTNIWKTEGIYQGGPDCSASDGSSAWSIPGNSYALNTHKIRLRRTDTGQWFYLCGNTADCRAM